jgi:hypothetical protein
MPEGADRVTAMSKPVDEILQSILDDFAASRQTPEQLEAKALFRLLNYCPPNGAGPMSAACSPKGQGSSGEP